MYPLIVALLGTLLNRKVRKKEFQPSVSILVSAYNEEEVIEKMLQNKLALDYPKDKVEILVVSDGSTDRTDEIVKKYEREGVTLMRQEPRKGKTAALNLAVRRAKGEIIVFSDANSTYERDAVKQLIKNFHDSEVGYVTGQMVYVYDSHTTVEEGCTAYMRYENLLRRMETRAGSIVGVDGGIDAMRRDLYRDMRPDQLPDFVLPLRVVEKGYRVVYEPDAILKEPSLKEEKDEYSMRVRVTLRALWALRDMRRLLTFKLDPLFSWELWSHKVLRYLAFIFIAAGYLSNVALWGAGHFYKFIFILQTAGFAAAVSSKVFRRLGWDIKVFQMVEYFVLLNAACAHAFMKFVLGHKQITWTPRKGA
jgi:cellulose synthase/poly-beta-1,6-N-acetylglucosamine synthase-like glycosyltransferase